MNGYLEACRLRLRNEPDDVERARVKGRVDAIVEFDKAVMEYSRGY